MSALKSNNNRGHLCFKHRFHERVVWLDDDAVQDKIILTCIYGVHTARWRRSSQRDSDNKGSQPPHGTRTPSVARANVSPIRFCVGLLRQRECDCASDPRRFYCDRDLRLTSGPCVTGPAALSRSGRAPLFKSGLCLVAKYFVKSTL